MVNALKGKTLTTMTVILPNEEVAADWKMTIEFFNCSIET